MCTYSLEQSAIITTSKMYKGIEPKAIAMRDIIEIITPVITLKVLLRFTFSCSATIFP